MADINDSFQSLDAQVDDLELAVDATRNVSAVFRAELEAMRVNLAESSTYVNGLSRSIGWGLRRAFDGLAFDGKNLTQVMHGLAKSIADAALTRALMPVQNHFGQMIAGGVETLVGNLMPFQNGAAFSQGRVTAFARGGVVSQATNFPMRGGMGLMGEAGPEAIMPLARGADGRLGVQAAGTGRPVMVNMTISTPDAEGFRRSRSQIAAQMGRAIARASRSN